MCIRDRDIQRRIQALSKFVRYSQQSLMLGAGALLVIKGELTVGGMIAANVLMSRALQPIDAIVGSWSGWQSARKAFESLEALLRDHPKRPAGMVHEDLRGEVRIENLVAVSYTHLAIRYRSRCLQPAMSSRIACTSLD